MDPWWNQYLASLADDNRAARKRALTGIKKKLSNEYFRDINQEDLEHVVGVLIKAILNEFSDPSESCREASINLVAEILQHLKNGEQLLQYTVPVLVARLGQPDIFEPSEELRLELIKLISLTLKDFKASMSPYVGDLVLVLRQTLQDPYPEVKKEAAVCSANLADACPPSFYHQGEPLVKPLLQGLVHHHFKVRIACLKGLGRVIQHIHNSALDEVIPVLAKKTFDSNISVRREVVSVIGSWLQHLVDRYSYQHKLVPLLLVCVTDEIEETRREAWEIWENVGKQYEDENEQELKDKLDFPKHQDVPPGLEFGRPRVGCRVIVQRSFHKILPALLKDLSDWTNVSRFQASSLLATLVYHLEEDVTQSLEKLLIGLFHAFCDEEAKVMENVRRCAFCVGFYVSMDIWGPLMTSAVMTSAGCRGSILSPVPVGPVQCTGCLLSFHAFLKGTPGNQLNMHIDSVLECLLQEELYDTKHRPMLLAVLECVCTVLDKEVVVDEDQGGKLFTVILRLCVLNDSSEQSYIMNMFIKCAKILNCGSAVGLFEKYGKDILRPLCVQCKNWTVESPSCLLFTSFVRYADHTAAQFLDILIPTFKTCLDPSQDMDLRLHLLTVLIELILSEKLTTEEKAMFERFSEEIVMKIVIPNTIWKAGRTAAVLRTSALTCFQALLQCSMLPSMVADSLLSNVMSHLLSSLDDNSESTRNVAGNILRLLFDLKLPSLNIDYLHSLYPDLLKRLDDSSEEVRLTVADALCSYFQLFSRQTYDAMLFKAHCEAIYKAILVHLDDSSPKIQETILKVLKEACYLNPILLSELIHEVKAKHRSAMYCELLLKHITETKCT